MNLMKFLRAPLLGALVTGFAACTTQSGPTYTLKALNMPNQQAPIYRVSCDGLFESSKSCVRVAEEICKAQPVSLLEFVDGVSDAAPKSDPRELTFFCGQRTVQKPAQPAPAPQPPVSQAAPQRQLMLQGNANFVTDSAQLNPTATASLDRFLSANQGARFHRVAVTGYTDSTGPEAHNRTLSQARAISVADYLREGGLQAEQFLAQAKGSDDPVASNATAEGRMSNRRVEVQVFAE
ncbi:OmpA family protein [Paraburkholderia sp.]|uniref:OmpA family protein n=1 Tax=Paraburkholderia sp. TaxID=1926495 RepID=UPI00239D76A9|nr:OmpA family protein [Paraburkholderia sp.]MDE1183305.1 OmpA family protein [Paraburkholderia sp.]